MTELEKANIKIRCLELSQPGTFAPTTQTTEQHIEAAQKYFDFVAGKKPENKP